MEGAKQCAVCVGRRTAHYVMSLRTSEDWAGFLDMLIARGAAGIKVQLGPDGAVTGLDCMFRGPIAAPQPIARRPPTDEAPLQKPLPAGLGYG